MGSDFGTRQIGDTSNEQKSPPLGFDMAAPRRDEARSGALPLVALAATTTSCIAPELVFWIIAITRGCGDSNQLLGVQRASR